MAWHGEPRRHSLSARGIASGRKMRVYNSSTETFCRAIRISRQRPLSSGEKLKLNEYQDLADYVTLKFAKERVKVEYFNSWKEISDCDGEGQLSEGEKQDMAFNKDYGQFYEDARVVKITPNTTTATLLHELGHAVGLDNEDDAYEFADMTQSYKEWAKQRGKGS